jgi:hypothetical protein
MDDKIILVSDFWAAVNDFVGHHFVKIIDPKMVHSWMEFF